MTFRPENSSAGTYFELRAEMNVLVVLTTCQHPLDPALNYDPKPVDLIILQTPQPAADDFCRNFRAENLRSFELTRRYFAEA